MKRTYTVSHVTHVLNYFWPPFTKPPLLFPAHPLCLYPRLLPQTASFLFFILLLPHDRQLGNRLVCGAAPHSIPKATSGAARHIERSSSGIDGATANQSDDEGGGPAPLPSMTYANKFSNALAPKRILLKKPAPPPVTPRFVWQMCGKQEMLIE